MSKQSHNENSKNGFIPCSPASTVRIRLPESLLLLAPKEDLEESLAVFTQLHISKFQDIPSKGITSTVGIFLNDMIQKRLKTTSLDPMDSTHLSI